MLQSHITWSEGMIKVLLQGLDKEQSDTSRRLTNRALDIYRFDMPTCFFSRDLTEVFTTIIDRKVNSGEIDRNSGEIDRDSEEIDIL